MKQLGYGVNSVFSSYNAPVIARVSLRTGKKKKLIVPTTYTTHHTHPSRNAPKGRGRLETGFNSIGRGGSWRVSITHNLDHCFYRSVELVIGDICRFSPYNLVQSTAYRQWNNRPHFMQRRQQRKTRGLLCILRYS